MQHVFKKCLKCHGCKNAKCTRDISHHTFLVLTSRTIRSKRTQTATPTCQSAGTGGSVDPISHTFLVIASEEREDELWAP